MPQIRYATEETLRRAAEQELCLRSYEPEDASAFRSLNEEWIALHFSLEDRDREVLGDPQTHILAPGGHIFMATLPSRPEPIGCCALIPFAPGVFELSKMSVAPQVRGLGIGRRLLAYTIAQARRLGATSLFLGSSTKLENAVHLYESMGFRHLRPEELPAIQYRRASVFMSLTLSTLVTT